jgi:hypothetical protein
MNKHAQAIGRKARGVPKTYTPEELQKRTARLATALANRWPKKASDKVMKIKIGVYLVMALALPALAQTNRLSSTNDLRTLTGTYKNFHIEKVEPNGLVITYTPNGGGWGMTTVRFENLSQSLCKKYGYDPQQAAAFDIAQNEANADTKIQMISNLEAAQQKRMIEEAARQAELEREQADAAREREVEAQEAMAKAAMLAATNPPPPPPPPTIIQQQQQQINIQQNFIH